MGPVPAQVGTPAGGTSNPIRVSPDIAFSGEPPSRAPLKLPADGSLVIGGDTTISSHYQDTLFDIARRYGLGCEEIIRANPGVDIWLPGEGTRILIPGAASCRPYHAKALW